MPSLPGYFLYIIHAYIERSDIIISTNMNVMNIGGDKEIALFLRVSVCLCTSLTQHAMTSLLL